LLDFGSFITRLYTHVTAEGKETELLKVYSKTDLSKCSTAVTRSRLNSRSTDERIPEKKSNSLVVLHTIRGNRKSNQGIDIS
jgi:thymidine kinase